MLGDILQATEGVVRALGLVSGVVLIAAIVGHEARRVSEDRGRRARHRRVRQPWASWSGRVVAGAAAVFVTCTVLAVTNLVTTAL